MAYLLDSNVFIQAKNLHYGFDFCPAFWDWVENSNADGRVFSIEKVGDELLGGADELTTWAQQRGDEFFLKPDAAVVPSLQVTSQWAAGQGYDPAAVNTFLQVADYYLVAHAHAHGHDVVTHEVVAHTTKKIQDPERLHRHGRQVHDAIRDAARRASPIRARTELVTMARETAPW